jgi:catechol 2,3-dioxygenase-like lactoylglutathione lyase family enzyme
LTDPDVPPRFLNIDKCRYLGDPMSRIQLALNVEDVDAAVAFYEKYFRTPPAKRRPGYANFAIQDPPLKLVLIENPGKGATLNHLGVEVFSTEEVAAAKDRLEKAGLSTREETGTTCCYAVQDKVWVHDPDGAPWETYVVLADAPVGPHAVPAEKGSACCATESSACCPG